MLILWCELDDDDEEDEEEEDDDGEGVSLNRASRDFELKPSAGEVDVALPVAL